MKAAIVMEAGQVPVYGDFEDPTPVPGKSVIRVSAASLSHVTRSRASGRHYSYAGTLPFIPGIDGTGIAPDGRRLYFALPERPYGALAERCLVDDRYCVILPDALDDVSAAAMAIPGMSSWAALVERAKLRAGETVLVIGATGAAGRLAVQIAKHLGAGKVIATGRDTRSFDELRRLGAEVTVPLVQDRDRLEQDFSGEFRRGVDVVLDYLWGDSAETLIIAAAKAGPEGLPIRYVQIGAVSGPTIALPSAALRACALQLMGSGIGSLPFPTLLNSIRAVLEAAPSAGFRIVTSTLPLSQVNRAWSVTDSTSRVVLLPREGSTEGEL